MLYHKNFSVTKKFEFSYGHHLPDYLGDCQNPHGHNAVVEVEFTRPSEDEYKDNFDLVGVFDHTYEGMVLDFKTIKKYVGPIISNLDHTYLNQGNAFENTPPVVYQPPTAENITRYIRDKIFETEIGIGLIRVRVYETPDSYAEWRK